MILVTGDDLVTGNATAREDSFDEVRRLSFEHVHRSRDFIRALKPLAAGASTIEIFDATRVENL